MSFLLAIILWPIDYVWGLYAVLAGLMILGGVGLPVPEELSLLLGGFLAYLQFTDFWMTFLVLVTSAALGDSAAYFMGRMIGSWILSKVGRFKLIAVIVGKASKYFDRYGAKDIIFSRPLVGVRPAVLFLCFAES